MPFLERAAALTTIACIASLLLGSCSGNSEAPQPDGMTIRLVPEYSDSVSQYALEEATTSMPMVIKLEALGLANRFKEATVGSETSVRFTRLAPDVSFQLTLTERDGRQRTVHVRALPADFPAYTAQVSSPVAEGKIYTGLFTAFTPGNYAYNLILNADGTPHYFRRFANPVFNFHKIAYADGTVRYAYLDSPVGFDLNKGAAEGDMVLIDERFREVRRMRLGATAKHAALPAENHDVIIFGDDHWVLCAYDTRVVDLTAYGGKPDSKVVATVLQETKNGVVIWEWDSTDYPELYAASRNGNDYRNATRPLADYVHFNSIEYDPADEGFILSFRHLDALMKILPRRVPLGHPIPVKWTLGGDLDQFALTAERKFYHQHDARIVSRQGPNLTLSLFNNNNAHFSEHGSSVMVLTLNEDAKTALLVDEYADNNMRSTSQGSAQVLDTGRYFVGWGSNNVMTEVVNGVVTFKIDFPDNLNMYRARKLP